MSVQPGGEAGAQGGIADGLQCYDDQYVAKVQTVELVVDMPEPADEVDKPDQA